MIMFCLIGIHGDLPVTRLYKKETRNGLGHLPDEDGDKNVWWEQHGVRQKSATRFNLISLSSHQSAPPLFVHPRSQKIARPTAQKNRKNARFTITGDERHERVLTSETQKPENCQLNSSRGISPITCQPPRAVYLG